MKYYSLSDPGNVVFWFYLSGNPIGSAIFPRCSSAEKIKEHAIAQHRRVPLHFPPYGHESELWQSEVVLFDSGGRVKIRHVGG